MTLLTLAIVVGVLYATGTYLVLQRRAIRLILGLGLLTHAVNLLLFSSGGLGRGLPPVIMDKKAFAGDITPFVDPLPQALILTAIVISFAVTAFTVVLVNRRHALAKTSGDPTELLSTKTTDPFASIEHYSGGLDDDPDDYEWLEFSLADELRQRRSRIEAEKAEQAAAVDETQKEVVIDSSLVNRVVNEADNQKKGTGADELDSQDGDLSTSEAFTSEPNSDQDMPEQHASNETGSNKTDHNEGGQA